MNYILF